MAMGAGPASSAPWLGGIVSTQTIEETREALAEAEANEDQALVKVLRDKLSSLADEAVAPAQEKPAKRSRAKKT